MLVLGRKIGESLRIGEDVTVTVVRVTGQGVRLGVDAPRHVNVVRSELQQQHDICNSSLEQEIKQAG